MLDKHFTELGDVTVTVLGVAFKPGTDDIRESPALPVIRGLLERGARVTAFDPVARDEAARYFGEDVLHFADSLEEAVNGTRAVLLMTRWPEFNRLPELLAAMDEAPVLIDGRRVIPRSAVPRYEGIGIGTHGKRHQPA